MYVLNLLSWAKPPHLFLSYCRVYDLCCLPTFGELRQVENNKYININKHSRSYQDITCSFLYKYLPQTLKFWKHLVMCYFEDSLGAFVLNHRGSRGRNMVAFARWNLISDPSGPQEGRRGGLKDSPIKGLYLFASLLYYLCLSQFCCSINEWKKNLLLSEKVSVTPSCLSFPVLTWLPEWDFDQWRPVDTISKAAVC